MCDCCAEHAELCIAISPCMLVEPFHFFLVACSQPMHAINHQIREAVGLGNLELAMQLFDESQAKQMVRCKVRRC